MSHNFVADRHTHAKLFFRNGGSASYAVEYFSVAKMLSIPSVYIDRESIIKVQIEVELFPFDVRDVVNTMAGCEIFLK